MRFTVNLDCTPEEAREFFGMPDILPMQQAMMEEVSKRMSEGIQTMEPELLMKTWVPAIFQGWSQMQQNWWSQMSHLRPGQFTATPDSAAAAPEAPEPDTASSRPGSKKRK